jgi:hypothetical protein
MEAWPEWSRVYAGFSDGKFGQDPAAAPATDAAASSCSSAFQLATAVPPPDPQQFAIQATGRRSRDRWRKVREGWLFKDARSYLQENVKIAPRHVLSQHFSQTCQPKETDRRSEFTSLKKCGFDDVERSPDHSSLGYYVKLEIPYGYFPGDAFRCQYVSDFYATPKLAQDAACFDILTALFLRHPCQMRVKCATAMSNGAQALEDLCRMSDALIGDEDDALTLACCSGSSERCLK